MCVFHPLDEILFDLVGNCESDVVKNHIGGFWLKFRFFANRFEISKLGIQTRKTEFTSPKAFQNMHKIAQAPPEAQNKRVIIAKIVIVALYGVGVIGLSLPEYREYFLMLTPAQLLLTLVLLLGFHRGWTDAFPILAAAAFWIGFGAELIGIHTGYLFGDYVYGTTLGPMLWEVPIIIGVNWFILIYLTGAVFYKITDNDYYAALLGATAMTVIDYIMEPVAVALDMWYWKFEIIPAGNYFAWFGVAFLIHLIYRKAKFERANPLAAWMLVTMVLFFTILNFTLEL